MIVGLGGSGLGITPKQTESLKDLLKRLTIDGAVHRGMTGMETMIHNITRSVYPWIPIHVVPIIDIYSVLTFKPPPHTIVYQPDTPHVVNDAILKTIWGLIFLPENNREGIGPGWDLPHEAMSRGVPVMFIWPNGRLSMETDL